MQVLALCVAFLVGVLGAAAMFDLAAEPKSRLVYILIGVWLVLWTAPSLIYLWITAVFG